MEYKTEMAKQLRSRAGMFRDCASFGGATHLSGELLIDTADMLNAAADLFAAPSPSWIPVSERLPTRRDADEGARVWYSYSGFVWEVPYYDIDRSAMGHWLPKPAQPTPAPPTAAPAQPQGSNENE